MNQRHSTSRRPRTKRPPFVVAAWDEQEHRWVDWGELQSEGWIRKSAEKQFDQWNHPWFWFFKGLELNNAAT